MHRGRGGQHPPALVPVERAVPAGDRGPDVAHEQDDLTVLAPPADQRVPDPGWEPVERAGLQERQLPVGATGDERDEVGRGPGALEHERGAVGEAHPLQGAARPPVVAVDHGPLRRRGQHRPRIHRRGHGRTSSTSVAWRATRGGVPDPGAVHDVLDDEAAVEDEVVLVAPIPLAVGGREPHRGLDEHPVAGVGAAQRSALPPRHVQLLTQQRIDPGRAGHLEPPLRHIDGCGRWFQVTGRARIDALLREELDVPGRRCTALRRTDTSEGVLLETAVRFPAPDGERYWRDQHHLVFDGGLVVEHVVYCTGIWDATTVVRHTTDVELVQP